MFELSNRHEFLYCIKCGRNDMVYTAVDGTKFHTNFELFETVPGRFVRHDPVECFGPFAYSEPPSKIEEIVTLYSHLNEDWYMSHIPEQLTPREQAEETDIEQLAQLESFEKYFPSIEEILIDNIKVNHITYVGR